MKNTIRLTTRLFHLITSKKIFLCFMSLLAVSLLLNYLHFRSSIEIHSTPILSTIEIPTWSSKVDEEQLCKIPRLTPGGEDIRKIDKTSFNLPPCTKSNSSLFEIDLDSDLILLRPENDSFWKTNKCFYQHFYRDPNQPDFTLLTNDEYFEISPKTPKVIVPSEYETIYLWCQNTTNKKVHKFDEKNKKKNISYEDLLTQVQLRPDLENQLGKLPVNKKVDEGGQEALSVLYFGIDSSSHMNFLRNNPQSHNYLVNEMEALEFHGFNSVGAGTLWSVFPMWTGLSFTEFKKLCWKEDSDYFDDCPFIWKDFAKMGYRTSYIDDTPGLFTSNPQSGFKKQPFHYDFRGFTEGLDDITIGHDAHDKCSGSKLKAQVLLETLLKVASTFKDKPYWFSSWTVTLSHNHNSESQLLDPLILDTLKTLNERQLLDNTIFMIMSDHGMRYGALRQNTEQGFLEERLPILYIVLPKKLIRKYPMAFQNMKENTERLTTAYDVYYTMQDLMNLNEISQDRLSQRVLEKDFESRRGISLFLPVSKRRTCDMIDFLSVYCICLNRQDVNVTSKDVKNVVEAALKTMNKNLDKYPQCSQLKIVNVTTAKIFQAPASIQDEMARFGIKEKEAKRIRKNGITYQVGFQTMPGGGSFDVSVIKSINNDHYEITGIDRINAYGTGGDCVHKDKNVRPYCHCQ